MNQSSTTGRGTDYSASFSGRGEDKKDTSSSDSNPSDADTQSTQTELDRVRELILGPDSIQQRLRGAETDRLREILFGSHIEEYERRFNDLRRDIDRVLSDVRLVQDEVSDFEKNQTKRLETLERETRQAHNELRREFDRMRNQEAVLQQLVTQIRQQEVANQTIRENTEELRKMLNVQEQEIRAIKTTLSNSRDLYERKIDTIRREVRQGDDELLAELRRVTDRLNHQKTDRKALAAMLIEIATRLETGSSLTGLLEEINIAST